MMAPPGNRGRACCYLGRKFTQFLKVIYLMVIAFSNHSVHRDTFVIMCVNVIFHYLPIAVNSDTILAKSSPASMEKVLVFKCHFHPIQRVGNNKVRLPPFHQYRQASCKFLIRSSDNKPENRPSGLLGGP